MKACLVPLHALIFLVLIKMAVFEASMLKIQMWDGDWITTIYQAVTMASKAALAARLAALKEKRKEAAEENHKQVVEEDRVSKLPKGYERKLANAEWEREDAAKRKAAEEAGKDYDRIKAMNMTVDRAERWVAKRTHKNVDESIDTSTHAYAQLQQYKQLSKKMKPDVRHYQASMEDVDDDGADSLRHGSHQPTAAAIDAMVTNLEATIAKKEARKKKTRLDRATHQDTDVDAINDKNRNFNRSLERFYGSYSKEIKDSLERGTAL
eukprot:m.90314 g.90314  ORF g.90314 m.90314 type:complete len:266 (-) comp14874_c1_seq1:56-853(-)